MSDFKHLPGPLLRSPSMISTSDGGVSPLTDLASPLFRSVNTLFRVDREEDPLWTNILHIDICARFRVDEYEVGGSIDLVTNIYPRLVDVISTDLFIPLVDRSDLSLTSLMVISECKRLPLMVPVKVDGADLVFIKSHRRTCACVKCVGLIQYILERGERVGKFDYLPKIFPGLGSDVALSGFKIKVARDPFKMGVAVMIDSLVKWFGHSICLLEVLLSARNRAELDKFVCGNWVYTPYNGRFYRVKRIAHEMTPLSSAFFDKKTNQLVTYAEHVYQKYGLDALQFPSSPLVEVIPDKRSESCLLIPELCVLMRPHEQQMPIVHSQTRMPPQDRFSIIDGLGTPNIRDKFREVFSLQSIRVESANESCSRVVCYPIAKRGLRWLSVSIDSSHRIEGPLGPPVESITTNTRDYSSAIRSAVIRYPEIEFVLVTLRGKSGVYSEIKYLCLAELGLPCQVVREETLSLPNIVPVICDEVMRKAFPMVPDHEGVGVVALDYHRFGEVSLFTICVMEEGHPIIVDYRMKTSQASIPAQEMADIYFDLIREKRTTMRPTVVYLASRKGLVETEILKQKLACVMSDFTLVIVCVRTELRFFSADGGNVSPGRAVTTDSGFFLVPHSVVNGNALPVHYLVEQVGEGAIGLIEAQKLTLKLCVDNHRLPTMFTHTLKLSELLGIHLRRFLGRNIRQIAESRGLKNLLDKHLCFYL
jgi:hypothetical protein